MWVAAFCVRAIGCACILSLPSVACSAGEAAFKDWAVKCDTQSQTCTTSLTAAHKDSGLWLASLHLRHADDGGAIILSQVPAGVHLASGFFVGVGQPLVQLEYHSCTQKICTATGRLSSSQLAAWRRANTAQVRYRPNVTSPPLSFRVSLMGITAALRYAKENQ